MEWRGAGGGGGGGTALAAGWSAGAASLEADPVPAVDATSRPARPAARWQREVFFIACRPTDQQVAFPRHPVSPCQLSTPAPTHLTWPSPVRRTEFGTFVPGTSPPVTLNGEP